MTRSRSASGAARRQATQHPPPGGSNRRRGPQIGPLRITPTRVLLAVALIGSLAYGAYTVTVRDTSSIPMLTSGALVLGLVFVALAISGAISMRDAARQQRNGQAILFAIGGGLAAMIAAGCFAAAVVLALVGSA